jgi:cytochrome c oxidase subunit 2
VSPALYASASTVSDRVDLMIAFLVALSTIITVGVFSAITYFVVKYRRGSKADRTAPPTHDLTLEIVWSAIPMAIGIFIFAWGASLYYDEGRPPEGALQVYVIGKQWMWKVYYPDGQREINGLHVPVGRPVKLTLISQDVIHNFSIPAFRLKQDVLPGRYTTLWFEATQTGVYHLFCSQYCGVKHSEMTGLVHVVEPARYERWLAGREGAEPTENAGERLFTKLGCAACHRSETITRGPALDGLFGKSVQLQGGQTIVADENYVRESILDPRAKIVAGFEPVMPAFAGLINDQELIELLVYIKSLGAKKKD